ncbi:MAG: phosphatidylglycerol lysyltransferase domain-containing protein [Deltaproteobacteria bacterium]|jgi:hypothetical protein|nr:phosphatidylglycerol lysyltransferase domain-containing protein [Deltaproteobacteria bacterium]
MPFKTLTLEDGAVFAEQAAKHPLTGSDANFTNMFIWMNYYGFSWTREGDCLIVRSCPGEGEGECFCFPPLGDFKNAGVWDFAAASMEKPLFSRVPREAMEFVAKERPSWRIEPDRDNDDYVYLNEKLKTLSGRSMHQKKNHYNYFRQNHKHSLEPITPALHDELVAVEDKWLTSKLEAGVSESHLIKEKEAIHAILTHFDELGVAGLAVKVDGAIEAFSVGEMLNEDTVVVHVEKGNPELRGIYVALFSNFCGLIFPDAVYVNREQDLGLPGLRRSKESLKPLRMVEKFKIYPEP